MSRRDVKTITVIVPSRGAIMPFTVTSATSLAELISVAGCPDWYSLSLTRKGPAISLSNRRLLDVVHHKGKLYLSPPTNSQQLDLPLRNSAAPVNGAATTLNNAPTEDADTLAVRSGIPAPSDRPAQT